MSGLKAATPAKSGNLTCRNAFRFAVVRMVFDEQGGKWSIARKSDARRAQVLLDKFVAFHAVVSIV
jgi:hypothetical protein